MKQKRRKRKLRRGRLLILVLVPVLALILCLKVCGSRSDRSDAAAGMEGAETVFDEEADDVDAVEGDFAEGEASGGDADAAASGEDTGTENAGETADGETSGTAAVTQVSASDFTDLDPVVLVYAVSADKGAIGDLWANAFAEKIVEVTGGKMTVDYYGQRELGSDQDIILQMQAGTVDCCNMQAVNVEPYVAAMSVLELPYVFAGYNAQTIDNVLKPGNEFWDTLYSEYQDSGFELIDFLQDGTYCQLTCTKAISSRADFRSLTIGTFSTYQRSFWGNLGCGAKSMNADDLYTSLQNGLVDSGETSLDTQVSTKLYEQQPYVIMTNRLLYGYPFFITSTMWNSLDPAYQTAISQASLATSSALQSKLQEINDEAKQTLAANGVQFIELDSDTINAMIEANAATTERIRAIAGDDICNQLINGLAGRDVIAEQASIAAAEKEKAKASKKK